MLVELLREAASSAIVERGRTEVRRFPSGGLRNLVAVHRRRDRTSTLPARQDKDDCDAHLIVVRDQWRSSHIFLPPDQPREAFRQTGRAQEAERAAYKVGGVAEEPAERAGAKGGSTGLRADHAVSVAYLATTILSNPP